MPIRRYRTPAAHGIMNVAPKQPFCILVSVLSDEQFYLPKRIIIGQCDTPPDATHTVGFDNQNVS